MFSTSAFSARHILPVLWPQSPSSIRNIVERCGFREQLRQNCLQVYELYLFSQVVLYVLYIFRFIVNWEPEYTDIN